SPPGTAAEPDVLRPIHDQTAYVTTLRYEPISLCSGTTHPESNHLSAAFPCSVRFHACKRQAHRRHCRGAEVDYPGNAHSPGRVTGIRSPEADSGVICPDSWWKIHPLVAPRAR